MMGLQQTELFANIRQVAEAKGFGGTGENIATRQLICNEDISESRQNWSRMEEV